MDIGIHVASFTWPGGPSAIGGHLADIARIADGAGFDTLHVMDHFFQLDDYFPAEEPMLEGYTTLGFLAGLTQRIRLGLLVGGVTYRHPGLLAKTITTLDVLSGGRADLGLGAAWYEREHAGLGVPFPPLSTRFEMLEETIQICLQMWAEGTDAYQGTHFELRETLNSPPPLSEPHPPIMIGGSGEKKTLRMVAQYADACNLIVSDPAQAAHKLAVLRSHCDRLGTDYEAIRRTMLYTGSALLAGDFDGFTGEMAAFAEAGIQSVKVMPFGPEPAALVAAIAEHALPRVAEL